MSSVSSMVPIRVFLSNGKEVNVKEFPTQEQLKKLEGGALQLPDGRKISDLRGVYSGSQGLGMKGKLGDQKIFVKIAAKTSSQNDLPSATRAFQLEANALERVKHVATAVHLIGLYSFDNVPVLAEERPKGKDLFSVWEERGIISCSELRAIGKGILLALQEIDPLWHCDLKPENVIYSPWTRTLRIVDFGHARDKKSEGIGFGSRGRRAPELLLGSSVTDRSADIWALGCFLFSLATGQELFPLPRGEKRAAAEIEVIESVIGEKIPDELVETAREKFRESVRCRAPLTKTDPTPLNHELSRIHCFTADVREQFSDLIRKMLRPGKDRISIVEALQHPFFREDRMFTVSLPATRERYMLELESKTGPFDPPWYCKLNEARLGKSPSHLPVEKDNRYVAVMRDPTGMVIARHELIIEEGDVLNVTKDWKLVKEVPMASAAGGGGGGASAMV